MVDVVPVVNLGTQTNISVFPILIIVTLVVVFVAYWKTKNLAKVGFSLQTLFGLYAFLISTFTLTDSFLMISLDLVSVALIIGGLASFFKK